MTGTIDSNTDKYLRLYQKWRDDWLIEAVTQPCAGENVKMLLAGGANVHAHGDRALEEAAGRDKVDVVKTLLAAGADVHARNDRAIVTAAWYGRTYSVKLLLDAGADAHEALKVAEREGRGDTAEVLRAHIRATEVRDLPPPRSKAPSP